MIARAVGNRWMRGTLRSNVSRGKEIQKWKESTTARGGYLADDLIDQCNVTCSGLIPITRRSQSQHSVYANNQSIPPGRHSSDAKNLERTSAVSLSSPVGPLFDPTSSHVWSGVSNVAHSKSAESMGPKPRLFAVFIVFEG